MPKKPSDCSDPVIHLYSPIHFETWDWTAADRGIGGSETHHIELAWRLARRGYQVVSYCPLPPDSAHEHDGVRWLPLAEADFTQPGVWVIYRSPETLEKFAEEHPHQQVWFVAQDEWYPSWQERHSRIVDKFIALCATQGRACARRQPLLAERLVSCGNGLRVDLLRKIEREGIVRIPTKLIYASSPDRGLKGLLTIFTRAREFVPALELHVCYGFDNIDKLIALNPKFSFYRRVKADIERLLGQPGVTWHGRVSQADLYRHWLSAGLWCYPTNFTETSCITCMEAQAMGAIPITHPLWALAENVHHGVFIEGDAYGDPLVRARYAAWIVRLASDPALQDQIRRDMMDWARVQFNWERIVDMWDLWLQGIEPLSMRHSQFTFQHKYAHGDILNLGCDVDPSDFKSRGAINVDIVRESPILRQPTKADVFADARALPASLYGSFDTVILGDILEHMDDADMLRTLQQSKRCVRNGGVIIITCPDDARPVAAQHTNGTTTEDYVPGVSCYHRRPISRAHLEGLIRQAGMAVRQYQPLDYTHFEGHGLLCF